MVSHTIADIKTQAVQFADQIKQVAEYAEKEEEIRIAAEKALAIIWRDMGITIRGRHEYTIGTGRADSVYGCVIIEYKNPHDPAKKLSSDKNSRGNQEVVKQIKNRFFDFKKEYHQTLESMFGVGCDGNYFIFIKYRDGNWFIEDPVEVTQYSSERFLWALINMGTKGKPFAPEYLSGDFGAASPLARDGIYSLYNTILSTTDPKTQVFFQQWKILFGEVCGYDVSTPSDKIQKLADFYGISDTPQPAELLFAVHTYYAIFMKLLASEIVAFFHNLPTPLQKILKAPTSKKLKEEMLDLESGSIFKHLNVTNFLEGDLFAWYPSAWNDSIDKLIRDMANRLDSYNPGTLSEDPSGSRDLLKKLYQELFPKTVRHDLGEYYTPDWLAEHVLNELDYSGDPDLRLLDPACGSGTFLIMTINRVRKWYDQNRASCGYDEEELSKKILDNIVGFDLNPLAVMAARTNYLIAMRDLIGRGDRVEVPVYLCDSVLTLSEYGGLDTWTTGSQIKTKELKTSVAQFKIPLEVASDRSSIAKYAEQLEFCIKNEYSPDEFLERCKDDGLVITASDLHKDLYEKLLVLDKENKNGVWARIIKNSFAPIFLEKVDFIAGNPPWVNWENLPEEYKREVKQIMQSYGLMSASGWAARLGSAKYDISMLFVYVCIDKYLKTNGKLGFVITQSVFQSDAGKGFRNFKIPVRNNEVPFAPLVADDMTAFQPFDDASNRTSTVIFQRNKQLDYPIPYNIWHPLSTISSQMELAKIKSLIRIENRTAKPVNQQDISSRWIIGGDELDSGIQKILGSSHYTGEMGSNTEGSNGVFWVEILRNIDKNNVLVKNFIKGLKKPIPQVTQTIEKDLLHPLLRSGDVTRWYAKSNIYLIFLSKHIRDKIKEPVLKQKMPKLFAYLHQYKAALLSRKSFVGKMGTQGYPFYTMYGSASMMAPYKVLWNRMGSDVNAAVVIEYDDDNLGKCSPIPQETLIYVPLTNEEEAYYLCGMINTSIVNATAKRYSLEGSKSFASVHLLENVAIPQFKKSDESHKVIASLSKKCHIAAKKGDQTQIDKYEKEIDKIAAKIWKLSDYELEVIQESME
jgi:hypothetical protein